MSALYSWSPIEGAAAAIALEAQAQTSAPLELPTPAAAQLALTALASAEVLVRAVRARPVEAALLPYYGAICGPIAAANAAAFTSSSAPILGGAERLLLDLERGASADVAAQYRPIVLHYLASQRATRELVRSAGLRAEAISGPLPTLPLPAVQGDPRFLAGARILVAVLGTAAIAAGAWATSDVAATTSRVDLEKFRASQQVRAATELAAMAAANGQPISVPDIVREIGERELASIRWTPILAGAIGLALGGAVALGVARRRA